MTQFKPGDRVTHNPTGEEWTLICGCTTSDEREACIRACEAVVL